MDFSQYLNYAIGFIVIFTIARSMLPTNIVDMFLIVGAFVFVGYYIYNEGIYDKYVNENNEYEPARKR